MNSCHVSLSDSNTTIILNRVGWYKLSISTTWYSLDSGSYYQIRVYKNGVFYHVPLYLNFPTDIHRPVNIEILMDSDGDDAYRIYFSSSPGE